MLKKIFRYCKITIVSAPLYFILNILFVFFIAASWLMINYSSKLIVDSTVHAQKLKTFTPSAIIACIVFFLAITFGGNYFNFQDMMTTIYTKNSRKLFSRMFLFKSYKTQQDKFYDGDFYNNYEFVKKNIAATSDITVSIFNNLLISIFSVLLSITAVLNFDSYILICILALSIGLTFLNKYLVKKRVELNQKYVQDERKANYYKEILSDRRYSRELRIFKLKDEFIKRWDKSYRKYSIAKFDFDVKSTILGSVIGFLQLIMEKGIDIYFLYLAFKGRVTSGDCVFLIALMGSLTRGITNVVSILSSEINEKYKYADEYDRFTGGLKDSEVKASSSSENTNIDLPAREFNELKLENVSFKYPNSSKDVLNNINFTLKKGEVVSILGYNGSGKTTVSKVMCGLLENYTGSITINGVDIKKLNREEFFKYFGIAFQEFSKYSISLKENIQVGMVEKMKDAAELSKAMDKGNIKSIAERLPDGENTILGKEYDKNGQDLSGGQWQRVILSRAYMGSPEVLILDEPTAAIDPIEEMRMLNQFKDIVKGKTALMISHRIGFARLSDRICIMEGGKIVEEGSHDDLLRLKGRYYELFTSQKELYKEEAI